MASFWNKGLYISIFGESYSKAIGVVVDNFPFGVAINLEQIKKDLNLRSTFNQRVGVSKRKEKDCFKILSGVFNGHSTGAPICAIIYNKQLNSSFYEKIKNLVRPSHADYGAGLRYGFFNDFKGGGHLSGRLTALLVFAGSLAKMALKTKKIKSFAHILSIGKIKDLEFENLNFNFLKLKRLKEKKLAVLDDEKMEKMIKKIEQVKKNKDSIGAVVECCVLNVPAGIGSPIFDGIENFLSYLIFSIPAVKGIEFGKGFKLAEMKGSEANDEFFIKNKKIKTKTNNNGGILGGISTGMPIVFKVVFKPTPTIFKCQNTVNLKTKKNEKIKCFGNHDSCIATRGVFVVEAVANIAILSQLIFQGKF